MAEDGPRTLKIKEDRLAWRETGEEIVVLDLPGSVYFGLNPTAASLWRLLVDGATREELVARLVAGQRVDLARASEDLDAFLVALRHEGLLAAPAA